jgi:GMP synthase-like glutamine amidotransferase
MILIVDMNYKKDSLGIYEFVLPIVSIVKNFEAHVIRHYSELSQTDIDNCTRVILSGNALRDKWTLERIGDFAWIRRCEKPLLGICSGMQTIGLVFGSSLKRRLEIGMRQITTVKENPLFSSSFEAYELHSCSIQPSKELDVLAESDGCVEAVKHKKRDMYGVLFHPEVRNREIIERFTLLPTRQACRSRMIKEDISHVDNDNCMRGD